ncbi:butyrophilin-like protein 10 isoform X2 [Mugil cephalus]|uniref:butyrophilin-like protein 10 isoform X2 n=1 Tax=Mugil cephalus TaxID=48193 RepID=UPI001FB6937B|nr:butyrophilin-like protein 10 isoform X2 [Mugil cephalus]
MMRPSKAEFKESLHSFPLWTLTLCLVSVGSIPVQGDSQVTGSPHPVVVALGEDAVLPCHVEPPVETEKLTVEWWRPDLPPDPGDPLSQYKYVHRYHNSQDMEDMKMPSYAGRTELFKGELKDGNVSLKIINVNAFDQGWYRCFLPLLQNTKRATSIQLVVGPQSVKTSRTQTPPPSSLQTRPALTEDTNIKVTHSSPLWGGFIIRWSAPCRNICCCCSFLGARPGWRRRSMAVEAEVSNYCQTRLPSVTPFCMHLF